VSELNVSQSVWIIFQQYSGFPRGIEKVLNLAKMYISIEKVGCSKLKRNQKYLRIILPKANKFLMQCYVMCKIEFMIKTFVK